MSETMPEVTWEDGLIKIDGDTLPGLLVEQSIDGAVRFDEQKPDGASGSKRTPQGWENGNVNLTLILLTDAESDCYEKLEIITKLFKGHDSKANPKVLSVTNRHLMAWGISELIFSGLSSYESDEDDTIYATLVFTENNPPIVKTEKQVAKSAGEAAKKAKAPAIDPTSAATTQGQAASDKVIDINLNLRGLGQRPKSPKGNNMSITGLDIDLKVGPFTVNRSQGVTLEYQRGAVASKAVIALPDTEGLVAQTLKNDDEVNLYFGYRGGLSQSWAGRITNLAALGDQVQITALGPELAFIKTTVVECFRSESARAVVRRLMTLAGAAPGNLTGPDQILPHMIFNGQSVYKCFKQINETLAKTYQLDLSKSPFWIGQDNKAHWGDFDEPGPIPILASQDNLLSHNPKGESGVARSILCPGLVASQLFKIIDARRTLEITKRAQTVRHELGPKGNITTVTYGPERGYA